MENQESPENGLGIKNKKPTIQETVAALLIWQGNVLPATVFYGLSDLTSDEISTFESTWLQLSPDRRREILIQLTEASESNFELGYRELGFMALKDDEERVRKAGIELLWEDESTELMSKFIDMAQFDESSEVRATAASALGRFILLGEYEEIPEQDAVRAQDAVIGLLNDQQEDLEVRRRSLEAISNSSHDIVPEAIEEAYHSDERLMQVSAVFAMGRSYDQRWRDIVLKEMKNNDSEIRYEAARAAGELEIDEAIPSLAEIAVNDEREIKEVAIWSLGEIGGRKAMRILSALAEDAEEADDNELLEVVEDAIGNASLFDELEIDDEDESYLLN